MTYRIVRFFADESKPSKVIKEGLSLQEAKDWCNDPTTHKKGEWFDGFREE